MPPIFFLHVPKTGGTSVVQSLKEACPTPQVIVVPERNPQGDYLSMADKFAWAIDNRLALREAHFICGHYLYGLHECIGAAPYYVTVFREPLDRMASQFRHVQASRSKNLPQHLQVHDMDFDAFTRYDWPRDATRYHCAPNVYTYLLSGGKEPNEASLSRALEHLTQHFRWIGQLCRLDNFIHALGMAAQLQLQAVKKGVNEEVPPFEIAPATREEFHRRNELDYQLYQVALTQANG